MPYNLMVLGSRLPGVTHEEFKRRYERHISEVIPPLCKATNAMPLSHLRHYISHSSSTAEGVDEPVVLFDHEGSTHYDVVVRMAFEDEAASQRFMAAVSTEEAARIVAEDEAGFWDRSRMQVVVLGGVEETKRG